MRFNQEDLGMPVPQPEDDMSIFKDILRQVEQRLVKAGIRCRVKDIKERCVGEDGFDQVMVLSFINEGCVVSDGLSFPGLNDAHPLAEAIEGLVAQIRDRVKRKGKATFSLGRQPGSINLRCHYRTNKVAVNGLRMFDPVFGRFVSRADFLFKAA